MFAELGHVATIIAFIVTLLLSIIPMLGAYLNDMRLRVRERFAQGDSDKEIITFMRERYGDFVLLKPPVQANT